MPLSSVVVVGHHGAMTRRVGLDFALLFVFIGAWAFWVLGALLVIQVSIGWTIAWAAGGVVLLLLNVRYARNPPSKKGT